MLFGQSPADPETIAGQITAAICRPEVKDCSPDWTRTIKEALSRYGEEKGFRVYSSLTRSGKRAGEWLLDIVWYNTTTGTISLAVESEWGNENDVLDDFEKLLCVKAPLKVMIYFAYKGSLISGFEQYLSVFDHHVQGEKYLVIEFHGSNSCVYMYEVLENGAAIAPRFSELALERAASA
jgi:hypothetical protein